MRVGTRGSALALAQTRLVAQQLQDAGQRTVEIVTIATAGDRDATSGDKSRWTGALERALAAREIDLAVHSAKDLPGELGEGLQLHGAPPRADVEDVLCLPAHGPCPSGTAAEGVGDLDLLRSAARVGTSSLRRAAQLRAARADIEIVELHGNVDTRLRKLATERLDAVVLARAGLARLGLTDQPAVLLDPERFVPAPGQGALALQGRAGDAATQAAVDAIADTDTLACLRAERALAATLGASCDTPLGARASADGDGRLRLCAWLGLPDGSVWLGDALLGDIHDPEQLGRRVAKRMLSSGTGELLQATLDIEHRPVGA